MVEEQLVSNTDPKPVHCVGPECRRILDPWREDVYPSPRLDRTYYCKECWLKYVVGPARAQSL